MSEWARISWKARSAGDMLRRNRESGEEMFAEFMAEHPLDGMLFFERGKARADSGDLAGAARDFKKAEAYFVRTEFKGKARGALERLTGNQSLQRPASRSLRPIHEPDLPSLKRAHEEFVRRERRAADFDVALRLLSEAEERPGMLSLAVPIAMLLQSWNYAYYQDGRVFDSAHFDQLGRVLAEHWVAIGPFRSRSLTSLSPDDEQTVKRIFEAFSRVVGRVGAAKALHLMAPSFFALWDNPIARAYGLDLSEPVNHYWQYLQIVRGQLDRLPDVPGMTPLKALDEYNYCRFTKGWV